MKGIKLGESRILGIPGVELGELVECLLWALHADAEVYTEALISIENRLFTSRTMMSFPRLARKVSRFIELPDLGFASHKEGQLHGIDQQGVLLALC